MASALISAGGSLLGGIAGGKGTSSAASAEAKAQQQQLALEQQQFNTLSSDATPNINAGNAANQQILRMLGLGDSNTGTSASPYTAEQQQQGAISQLQSSPLYTSEYNSGLDALNQSLAATGGLRGGNGALSESNFGSNLLNSLYQQQLGNLGSVVGTGQSALGALSGASANYVNSSANTTSALGNANATAAASPYAAFQNILSGIGSSGVLNGGTTAWNGSGAFPSAAYGW
jgi:hypothetical protein